MPTISQLPPAAQVTAADQIPISQGGSACSVSVGTLLASTQPAIMIPTGSLFGRTSLGAGGPDPVDVGTGLALNAGTLVATGADHAIFAQEATLTLTDQAVVNSAGTPRLLPLSLLRGLFSAGANISIDQNGTVSASAAGPAPGGSSGYSITALPTVGTIDANDLVAISQSGTDHTISYANFIDGQTIDEVQAAAPASDTDEFLVAQNGNVMARQTLAAMWSWLNAKLSAYQLPTLELTTDTILNAAAHNGRLLVCSQPITVTPALAAMGNGFVCTLINMSSGSVTLGSGIITSAGNSNLTPGQATMLSCLTYSGGTIVYGWTGTATTSLALPLQVIGLTIGAVTSSSVALSWTALTPSPLNYTVQFRASGTTAWSDASPVTGSAATISGLQSATSYDFAVFAVNVAGAGPASAIATTSTVAAAISVTSVTWNMVPSGSYSHGTGAIGVNAQITPSNAPVQFGFSNSPTVPSSNWTLGTYVNTNLWGAYVNTPAVAGTYYAWVEGTDGSTPTVYPTSFAVT